MVTIGLSHAAFRSVSLRSSLSLSFLNLFLCFSCVNSEHGEMLEAVQQLRNQLNAYQRSVDKTDEEYVRLRRSIMFASMQNSVQKRGDLSLIKEGLSVADIFFSKVCTHAACSFVKVLLIVDYRSPRLITSFLPWRKS